MEHFEGKSFVLFWQLQKSYIKILCLVLELIDEVLNKICEPDCSRCFCQPNVYIDTLFIHTVNLPTRAASCTCRESTIAYRPSAETREVTCSTSSTDATLSAFFITSDGIRAATATGITVPQFHFQRQSRAILTLVRLQQTRYPPFNEVQRLQFSRRKVVKGFNDDSD